MQFMSAKNTGAGVRLYLAYFFAVVLAIGLRPWQGAAWTEQLSLVFLLFTVPPLLAYPRWTLLLEHFTLWVVLVIMAGQGLDHPFLLGLPMVSAMLCWVTFPLSSSALVLLSMLLTAFFAVNLPFSANPVASGVLLVLTVAQWAILLVQERDARNTSIRHLDLVVASYSGNTAHIASSLVDGALGAGAEVTSHRFHYIDDPPPRLEGDGLALVFPVFGWKPPWPVMDLLLRGLPKGNGKPAFILYSAAGGPENTGVVAWALLKLRGYRVVGRSWGIYPLSVVTFRLGPAFLWKAMDRLTAWIFIPRAIDTDGRDLVLGRRAGMPVLLWPSPMPVVGFLLENKLINRFLYRNHAYRWRCNGCGLCVRYCPVGRLHMEDGLPRARGTCSLCMGCINHCPTGAMQIWFGSEYGQPYHSLWPKLVVKRRRSKPAGSANMEGSSTHGVAQD